MQKCRENLRMSESVLNELLSAKNVEMVVMKIEIAL